MGIAERGYATKPIEITKTIKEPGIAHKMVKYIGLLYKIEREALDKKLDPGGIKKLREEKAIPILGVIKKLVDEVKDATPPQSILGVTPRAIWHHPSHFECVLYKTLRHQIFSFA